MEVIVRNIEDQITDKQIDNFFRPVLDKFGIKIYHCEKLRRGGCATLTIADPAKARQFLHLHGQALPGRKGFATVKQGLRLAGRPVNCSLSNKTPDDFLLQSLREEESARYAAKKSLPAKIVPPKTSELRRAFDTLHLDCGQWDYAGDDLVFVTNFQQRRPGRLIFGPHSILVKLQPLEPSSPAHQLEIPYLSVQSFTIGSTADPSVTFSLYEAPKLFEMIDPEEELPQALAALSLSKPPRSGAKRRRISALSKAHETVVSSCLTYRFRLSVNSDIRAVRSLKRFPEIAQSFALHTNVIMRQPYASQMTQMNSALAGEAYGWLPFDIKFQIQKLAQNGYLTQSG